MRTLLASAVAVCVAFLGGSAGAGVPIPPPPGDRAPTWSPDASAIVFFSDRDGASLRVMNPDGTAERRIPWLPAVTTYEFSRDWSHIAAVAADRKVVVERLDGSDRLSLGTAAYATPPSWSPDGTRVAYVTPSATQGEVDVVVARIDGSEARRIATGSNAVWSPTDDRIAFLAGEFEHRQVRVIHADGSGETVVAEVLSGAYTNPRWSPDGTRLAAVRNRPDTPVQALLIFRAADGARLGAYPVSSSDYAWSPRGDAIALSSLSGSRLLDVATGRTTPLAAGFDVAWSPDGRRIAFVGGGECRDRLGIYVVEVDRQRPVRLTNGCRIVGTEGNDVVRGTPLADVLLGLGGDDRLIAVSQYFTGDTLEGGPGKDILSGSYASDELDGGPGPDVLRGGPSPDRLVGGAGPDSLDGQGGQDAIYARDGGADRVSCGTNAGRTTGPEGDVAYVDRADDVSADCEWVFRPGAAPAVRGRTSLLIRVWPEGQRGPTSPRRDYTLRCRPAGGTLPRPGFACARLGRIQNPFAPVPRAAVCAYLYGGDQLASVRGAYGGRRVWTTFSRVNTCEIARWNRLAFLFSVATG